MTCNLYLATCNLQLAACNNARFMQAREDGPPPPFSLVSQRRALLTVGIAALAVVLAVLRQ